MARSTVEMVAAQALEIADGWSPPDAPASWALTATTMRTIAEEPALLELAAEIPPDRLPPLLLSAAVQYLVAAREPAPLAGYYPHPGGPQPPLDSAFRAAFVAFCAAERAALGELCARHRYQMNEVGRSAAVLPVLAGIAEAHRRPLALVDLGTGAGLGCSSTATATASPAPAASTSSATRAHRSSWAAWCVAGRRCRCRARCPRSSPGSAWTSNRWTSPTPTSGAGSPRVSRPRLAR